MAWNHQTRNESLRNHLTHRQTDYRTHVILELLHTSVLQSTHVVYVSIQSSSYANTQSSVMTNLAPNLIICCCNTNNFLCHNVTNGVSWQCYCHISVTLVMEKFHNSISSNTNNHPSQDFLLNSINTFMYWLLLTSAFSKSWSIQKFSTR